MIQLLITFFLPYHRAAYHYQMSSISLSDSAIIKNVPTVTFNKVVQLCSVC